MPAFPLRNRLAKFFLNLLRPRHGDGCWNCARWNGERSHTERGCKWSYTSSKCWCNKWRTRKEASK